VIEILRRHGFAMVGASGSHQKWRHPLTRERVIVAYHRGRVLPLGNMMADFPRATAVTAGPFQTD